MVRVVVVLLLVIEKVSGKLLVLNMVMGLMLMKCKCRFGFGGWCCGRVVLMWVFC